MNRGLTQIFYRYMPEAVFYHEDYGICRVEHVELDTSVARDVDETALFAALGEALINWPESFREKFPDPRDERARTNAYLTGRPRQVVFRPYPKLFSCRRCGKVVRIQDPQKDRVSTRCRACGGSFEQLPYVQIHNCGRLEELYYPSKGCPQHGLEYLTLYDPGRVHLAFWRCSKCGREIQRLRMTPCSCNFSKDVAKDFFDKRMRVVATSDPAVHLAHTTAFVNLPHRETQRLSRPEIVPRLLARIWGIYTGALEDSHDSGNNASMELFEKMISLMPLAQRAELMQSPEMQRMKERIESRNASKEADERVRTLLGQYVSALDRGNALRRQVVEHAALLETRKLISIEDVARWARDRRNEKDALTIQKTSHMIRNFLGVAEVKAMDDFPIALCAYGYTRVTRDPARSEIRPFPPGPDGRLPLYVHPSETEALWFQLDPTRVARWLLENGLASGPVPDGREEAWAWIFRQAPSLWLYRVPAPEEERIANAIETLLHTMSHVLLKRIEWSGFSSSSIGEYLLPGTLSFVLFVSRYTGSKLGGLITLFEHRLSSWLWDSVQAGNECLYDPLCSDEGGSCVGCLHREYGCFNFNHNLSRATLYGGPTPVGEALEGKVIRHGYWESALAYQEA